MWRSNRQKHYGRTARGPLCEGYREWNGPSGVGDAAQESGMKTALDALCAFQQLLNNASVNVRQAEITTFVPERQTFMINAQAMQ